MIKPSTARHRDDVVEVFDVSHPFHPLHGRQLELLELRRGWQEERVFFCHDDGRMRSVPAAWTSLRTADPLVVTGAGRAYFRAVDLLAMVALLAL